MYQGVVTRLAQASGIETSTRETARLNRKRPNMNVKGV